MTNWFWSAFFLAQGAAIAVDEFYFHRKRGLPRWERLGHPLDTLSFLVCLAIACFVDWSPSGQRWFFAASLFSCVLITKDEWVHAEHCPAAELWLHAVLFVLHPLSLVSAGVFWFAATAENTTTIMDRGFLPDREWASRCLHLQFGALCLFGIYQLVYWNFPRRQLGSART